MADRQQEQVAAHFAVQAADPTAGLCRLETIAELLSYHCLTCLVYLQIVAAVAPQRERLDACVIFPSMPAVMKLNKLGTFSMAQLGQSKSIIGDFIK